MTKVIDNLTFKKHKEQLTAPKVGDTFCIDINIKNGHRFYNVNVGRKWMYFRELYACGVIKKTVTEGKRLLNNKYWECAKWDAFSKYCTLKAGDKRKKSLPKNWKGEY